MTPSRRDSLALWLLPALFVAALFAARAASLPFWQSFNLDPDYYYLLNGLRIVEGLAPTDVSHPGTPVQVLMAVIIRALHPFAPTSSVVDAVLANPEGHLVAATTVIYLMIGVSLWLLGRAAYAWGGLWPALLAQGAPFLQSIIVKMALHPKPEPFLVIAVAGLAAASFAACRSEGRRDGPALWAGVAMGFGVACKIHFVALGVVPLLLFDRRRLGLYLAACAASLLLFVAPMLPSLDIWLGWMHRVILGAGDYGAGADTVIDPHRYPHAVLRLFSARWFFTGGIVVSTLMLAAYVRLRRRSLLPADPLAGLLVGTLLGEFATVLLVAKQPAPHYMVPALLLTGPQLAVLWAMSRPILSPGVHRRLWLGLAAVLVVAPAIGTIKQVRELAGWTRDAQAFPMARFDGCAKVFFDAASAESFAFQRGDMNAQARYSPKLAKLFPTDEYTWFIFDHTWWKHGLMQWNQPVTLDELFTHYPCVVFRGNQYGRFQGVYGGAEKRTYDDMCPVGEEEIFTKGVTCDGRRMPALAK
jgi:hypothetical protein